MPSMTGLRIGPTSWVIPDRPLPIAVQRFRLKDMTETRCRFDEDRRSDRLFTVYSANSQTDR